MKIISVEDYTASYVEVEGHDRQTFRRYSSDTWEALLGMSWEEFYSCEEIEKQFQAFIRAKDGVIVAPNVTPIVEGGWFTKCPACEVRLKDNRFIDSDFNGTIICPVCDCVFDGRSSKEIL